VRSTSHYNWASDGTLKAPMAGEGGSGAVDLYGAPGARHSLSTEFSTCSARPENPLLLESPMNDLASQFIYGLMR
jgi:hypothetical protein